MKNFVFKKKVTLRSCKYNIILLINKKNNVIHRLLLTEMKNFVFTKKVTPRSCKYNIILLIRRIIYNNNITYCLKNEVTIINNIFTRIRCEYIITSTKCYCTI